uniref:transposase n=1 Tax=Sphingobacterium litopenaei TaxID=2763500 RepID=UPI001CC1D6F4|nr:transposase [Sphingobacterium litopenaei]
MIFPQNVSGHLSIDETCLSHGELYTVVTNKEARGKKETIVAILNGTKSENIIPILQKIPQRLRNKVQEITLDLAGNMGLIAKRCFPNAVQVIDRFHVQQLATEAPQEIRIKHRWQAIDDENQAIEGSKLTDEEVDILLKNMDISKLQERDEQEVVGYYEALDVIDENFEEIPVTENGLKNLHNVLLKYSEKIDGIGETISSTPMLSKRICLTEQHR